MVEKEDSINDKVEIAIKKLKSSDVEKRQEGAWDLQELAENERAKIKLAIPDLVAVLKDEDWAVRKLSLLALGYLDVKDQIPTMIDFLRNDINSEVRVGAAQALGDMKVEKAVPDLIQALDDSAVMVRQVSLYSLGLIGIPAKEAVPKVIEILNQPEDIELLQVSDIAAWVLGEIGDKSAIDSLSKALDNATYSERKVEIACALTRLEDGKGIGFSKLVKMKENFELNELQLELVENILKTY